MHKPAFRSLIAKHLSQLITTESRECVVIAGLQEDRRFHSTLERLRDDDTIRAPQALGPATIVGFDNGPELDGANIAPEVSNLHGY